MPRTFEQNQAIKEARKKKVCKAALRLFALNGFKDVAVDDITREAHCSHGLFYHYYKDQEDVFLSIEKDIMTRDNGKYLIDFEKLKQLGGIKGLNAFFEQFQIIDEGEDDVLYYYAILSQNDFELTRVPSAYYGPQDKVIFRDLIKQAMDEGAVRPGDPDEIASLCYFIVSGGLIRRMTLNRRPLSLEALKRVF